MRLRGGARFLLVGLCAAVGLTSIQPVAAGALPAAAASSLTSTLATLPAADNPSPDDLLRPAPDLGGTPIAPDAKSVQDLKNAQAPAQIPSQRSLATLSPAGLGAFAVSNDKPLVTGSRRPYSRSVAAPLGTGTRDATGVPMFKIGTRLYDHPVRQGQDGIMALESYRVNKDPRQLAQARLDAQRLLNRRVQRTPAYFFPYPFSFALHGNTADTIRAPWYSGMAQGLALSLFSRLSDVTKEPVWRVAADATFNSLLMPVSRQNTALPFVSWVDSSRHLWIDEYAQAPLTKADRTFNGHVFAVFGVWDYFVISQDPRATQIFAGALANLRYRVNRGWQTASWISRYCMTHGVPDAKYHQIHTGQLLSLHAITGSSFWSVWSDRFRDDYPPPVLARRVRFGAGTHTGYRFDSAGRVLARRGVTLNRASMAPASHRARIRTHGYYYLITAGSLSGYWVQEKAAAVYVPGLILSTPYPFARVAVFAAGSHTGWTMTTSLLRAGSRTIRLRSGSSASFDRSGWIDGASYVRIINGSLAGRWVPTRGLTLH